ncbi:hypothetical protein BH11PSE12_BH11PSE12_26370 [soil metagenome]
MRKNAGVSCTMPDKLSALVNMADKSLINDSLNIKNFPTGTTLNQENSARIYDYSVFIQKTSMGARHFVFRQRASVVYSLTFGECSDGGNITFRLALSLQGRLIYI